MKIFDLEQEIMECWKVCDDIKLVTDHFVDSPQWEELDGRVCDALINKYLAIQELYEVKFDKLWNTFEEVAKEYQRRGTLAQADREDWSFDD